MPDDNNDPQLNLEEVVEVAPDDLSDEQKVFLEENKTDLTDEQAVSFGIEREPEGPAEPEVRTASKPPASDDGKPPVADNEIDPDDEAMVGKVISRRLKPLEDQVKAQTDQVEVDGFIRENPEYSKYRGKILTYMKHPAYSNIPANNIAKIVAGGDLMKLGAQKEREARENADKSTGAGVSARTPKGGTKDWGTASKEAFEAKRIEVMSRPRGV